VFLDEVSVPRTKWGDTKHTVTAYSIKEMLSLLLESETNKHFINPNKNLRLFGANGQNVFIYNIGIVE
jgi:hypothetical protein